jgi:phosphatidylglycerol:prolipoprotein diacylglycerol transferase
MAEARFGAPHGRGAGVTHATQVPHGMPPALVSARAATIVVSYVTAFFGVLPGLLWMLGGRLDALLALPPIGVVLRSVGLMALVLGTAWMTWAMWLLWRTGAGLPISHLPPARFVTLGPYAVVRHPIYIGYVAAFAGAGAMAGSVGRSVIVGVLLAWGCAIYAVGFEEARLERRFGASYVAYRKTAPAFPVPLYPQLSALLEQAWTLCRPLAQRMANRVVLLRIGPTTWVTYGLFAAAGAATMGAWLAASLAGAGLAPPLIERCLVGLAVAIPLGSRALWLAYRADQLRRDSWGTLRSVGFVSWGGILGLVGFATGFAWVERLPLLGLLDAAAVAGLAGLAVARIGCFTYGCCYGRPSPLGIAWTDSEAKPVRELGTAGTATRVPTQLLSSAAATALFVLMLAVQQRGVPPGTVTGLTFLLYGTARFGIECLRADPRHGPWGLTQGHVGCLVATALGLVVLITIPAAAPRSSPPLDWGGALSVAPVLAGCVAVVFGVYGFHWRRVGRW